MTPFEGLFGDTSELELIDFLLPLTSDVQYSIAELMVETELSRPVVTDIVKKFADWEILKNVKHGKRNFYQVNDDSPFIKLFRDINGKIIARILGESAVDDLREYQQRRSSTSTSFEAIAATYYSFLRAYERTRLAKEPESAESSGYINYEPERTARPLPVISAV
jgi:DNA-binding transcriptional regulator GbsR (MarR family)